MPAPSRRPQGDRSAGKSVRLPAPIRPTHPAWAFAAGYSINLGFHTLTTGARFGGWYWLPRGGLNAFLVEVEAGSCSAGSPRAAGGFSLAVEYRAGTGVRPEGLSVAGPAAAFYVTAAPAMHLWGGGVMFGARVGAGVKVTLLETPLTLAMRYESYPLLGAGVEGMLLDLALR